LGLLSKEWSDKIKDKNQAQELSGFQNDTKGLEMEILQRCLESNNSYQNKITFVEIT